MSDDAESRFIAGEVERLLDRALAPNEIRNVQLVGRVDRGGDVPRIVPVDPEPVLTCERCGHQQPDHKPAHLGSICAGCGEQCRGGWFEAGYDRR